MVFEIEHGNSTLTYEGSKIAHVSPELPSKQRWTEFTIWLTSSGEFVLEGVGRTRVMGESDRRWSVISRDPVDVLDAIVGNDVSKLAKKLIAESLLALVGNVETS
jgi:hypothetical protein